MGVICLLKMHIVQPDTWTMQGRGQDEKTGGRLRKTRLGLEGRSVAWGQEKKPA